jgi:hypothetical protein
MTTNGNFLVINGSLICAFVFCTLKRSLGAVYFEIMCKKQLAKSQEQIQDKASAIYTMTQTDIASNTILDAMILR